MTEENTKQEVTEALETLAQNEQDQQEKEKNMSKKIGKITLGICGGIAALATIAIVALRVCTRNSDAETFDEDFDSCDLNDQEEPAVVSQAEEIVEPENKTE